MKIDQALISSLIKQYRLAKEDAQAKLPTMLTVAIEAIWREYDGQISAYVDAGIQEDKRRRAEGGPEYTGDADHRARMAGAL